MSRVKGDLFQWNEQIAWHTQYWSHFEKREEEMLFNFHSTSFAFRVLRFTFTFIEFSPSVFQSFSSESTFSFFAFIHFPFRTILIAIQNWLVSEWQCRQWLTDKTRQAREWRSEGVKELKRCRQPTSLTAHSFPVGVNAPQSAARCNSISTAMASLSHSLCKTRPRQWSGERQVQNNSNIFSLVFLPFHSKTNQNIAQQKKQHVWKPRKWFFLLFTVFVFPWREYLT